jgi:cysteine desulfurase/selenocysteine lyase
MFSFPGVPGIQSPPGVPPLPSSIPANPPDVADPRALIALADAPPDLSRVSGVLPSTVPASYGSFGSTEQTAPQAAPPQGIESFEFRPEVAPEDIARSNRPLDARLIRQDFPILQERVHGRQLIWLDNAATTQKPNAVIDRHIFTGTKIPTSIGPLTRSRRERPMPMKARERRRGAS